MRVLRAEARLAVPWRNGAGVTEEVAREGVDGDPGWRVSIATIDRNAPFSRYAAYDRTLVMLAGGPIALVGEGWDRLVSADEAVAFSGDDEVAVRIAAPARVLNVMTLRGRFGHDVRPNYAPLAIDAGTLSLALGDRLVAERTPLRRFDAAFGPCRIEGSGRLLSIRIAPQ